MHHCAGVTHTLGDRVEVKQRLVDRHRQHVLHLERQRFTDLAEGHLRHTEVARQHSLISDANNNFFRRETTGRPQLLDRRGHGVNFANFAANNRAFWQWNGCRPRNDGSRLVGVLDLNRAKAVKTKIQSNYPLCHLSPYVDVVILHARRPISATRSLRGTC